MGIDCICLIKFKYVSIDLNQVLFIDKKVLAHKMKINKNTKYENTKIQKCKKKNN